MYFLKLLKTTFMNLCRHMYPEPHHILNSNNSNNAVSSPDPIRANYYFLFHNEYQFETECFGFPVSDVT